MEHAAGAGEVVAGGGGRVVVGTVWLVAGGGAVVVVDSTAAGAGSVVVVVVDSTAAGAGSVVVVVVDSTAAGAGSVVVVVVDSTAAGAGSVVVVASTSARTGDAATVTKSTGRLSTMAATIGVAGRRWKVRFLKGKRSDLSVVNLHPKLALPSWRQPVFVVVADVAGGSRCRLSARSCRPSVRPGRRAPTLDT